MVGVVVVDAGVEEINGLDGIRPVREWYGYAFGLPDRHPTGFLWRGSMPIIVSLVSFVGFG